MIKLIIDDKLAKEKYNQKSIEEWVMNYWKDKEIYKKIKEKSSKSNKKFYFLDGPPYASAKTIHVGTLWNKVLKDTLLRYYRMKGFNVWDKPGFDTHGLPIEVQIEKKLGSNNKKDIVNKIGVDNFINKCLAFVKENINAMTKEFQEVGVFMDWENPYLTYEDSYIESGWYLIRKAYEKELLYKGKNVLHWCPRCETTLADYEVSEYKELEDPSVYVKFKVKNEENTYLLIWTTTPWTLPANAFVMAHPDIDYVMIEANDEKLILSKERLGKVIEESKIKEYKVIKEFKGKELEGMEYIHPLEDLVKAQKELKKYHKVVMASEAVVSGEGTGLVHSAPGHGEIDAIVGSRIGAPLISLVNDQGFMVEEAGKYAGLYFRTDANKEILKDLKEKGALLHLGKIKHRYPVCWRCKTPLLLRATEQWFIKVSKIKDRLIKEANNAEWVPTWAKDRFMNIVGNVRDWVISRQRFWGIPLPIWECENCHHIEVVGSLDDILRLNGKRPLNMHRPWIDDVILKCPKCGGQMKRVNDVLDVWFDSGIAFYASLNYPKNKDLYESLSPADLILEGHDQTRGWFFSLLRSGVIGFDSVPYRRVLLHGFVLDEQGREMHKSAGNYVSFEELISKVSRDLIRLYVLQNTTWEDLKFSWKGTEQLSRNFTIIWNIFSFASMYMSLDKFDPKNNKLEELPLETEDKWLLSRLNNLIRSFNKYYSSLEVHNAARLVIDFIVEDVSHWYLKLIRKRVWEDEDTPSKRAAYATLYYTLKNWLLLSTPIIPFISEYLYQKFVKPAEPDLPESVSLLEIPDADLSYIDEKLESKMELAKKIIENTLSARMKAGIKIRVPIKSLIISTHENGVKDTINEMENYIKEMANVKDIQVVGQEFFEQAKIYKLEPNYKELGPSFKKILPIIIQEVKNKEVEVGQSLVKNGYYELNINGQEVRLETKHFKIQASYPEWLEVSESDIGVIAIDKRVSEEEQSEGLARDVIRRIQYMRKELGLPVDAYIETWIKTDDNEYLSSIKTLESYIKNETRSKSINYSDPPGDSYSKEWEVEEKRITIGIKLKQ
ncbi:MAG: isoleucine--tRNA ligase [Caldisphaera sp.]